MNILITGGASGLGAAITRKIAEDASHRVYFTYSKSKDEADAIAGKYKNTQAIHCDFSSADSINGLLAAMDNMQPDVLINNAFTGFQKKHFHKLDATYFTESFTRNIVPTIQVTQKAILGFRKKKFGKIITVLSAAIINKPPVGWSEYAAAKNYLLSLSKSWATENSSSNITSNCISPSFMKTALTADTDERIMTEMEQSHPLKKLLSIEEVADNVAWLINASQQINGINLLINAGTDVV